jgi:hypothetical protein
VLWKASEELGKPAQIRADWERIGVWAFHHAAYAATYGLELYPRKDVKNGPAGDGG